MEDGERDGGRRFEESWSHREGACAKTSPDTVPRPDSALRRLRQENVGQLIGPISEVVFACAAAFVAQTAAGGFGVRVHLAATAASAATTRQEHETNCDDTEPPDANCIWQHETSLSKRPDDKDAVFRTWLPAGLRRAAVQPYATYRRGSLANATPLQRAKS